MQNSQTLNKFIQGSPEWLALRKTKITATDAPVIMGVSPWKTAYELYHEKLSDEPPMKPTGYMQRGIDLEPFARELFCLKTGLFMVPRVVIKDWAMASLDGINEKNEILEVKCPGEKDHALALAGKIPEYYYPQLQHQMFVCDAEKAFYFSFDGFDGVIIEVKRDEEYIKKMVEEEKKFFQCLLNKTPPENKKAFVEKNDEEWLITVKELKIVTDQLKELEKKQEELKEKLIFLTGNLNSKGGGVSLSLIERKGNINYASIEELKKIDLEKYRGKSTTFWKVSWE